MIQQHIFFKDKQGELKGPFTERQVQEWYRKAWFDGAFEFAFLADAEGPPAEDATFHTLDRLISLNGVGSPFKPIRGEAEADGDAQRKREAEDRLAAIEKELLNLRLTSATLALIEKRVAQIESALENSPAPAAPNQAYAQPTLPVEPAKKEESLPPTPKQPQRLPFAALPPLVKPANVSNEHWAIFEEQAKVFATVTAASFTIYGLGEFSNELALFHDFEAEFKTFLVWLDSKKGKQQFKRVCERRLIERLQEEEHFCCAPCGETLFNYKQALIHFFSETHARKDSEKVSASGLPRVRAIVIEVTNLPAQWTAADERVEIERFARLGRASTYEIFSDILLPLASWVEMFTLKYMKLIYTYGTTCFDPVSDRKPYVRSTATLEAAAKIAVENAKGEIGARAFRELHAHCGRHMTRCMLCMVKTGGREEFYEHVCNSLHMNAVAKESDHFDLITMIVNLHRRDLIQP